MKNRFTVFSIRFLTILLFGMFLLLLRAVASNPVCAIFAPRCASAWELSKMVYWPMLIALAMTRGTEGDAQKKAVSWLPWMVITPAVTVAAFWGLSMLQPGPGIYLLVWIIVCAIALALMQRGVLSSLDRSIWLVLTVALGIAYIILTFLPPMCGPFIDPTDVAAMATIPC